MLVAVLKYTAIALVLASLPVVSVEGATYTRLPVSMQQALQSVQPVATSYPNAMDQTLAMPMPIPPQVPSTSAPAIGALDGPANGTVFDASVPEDASAAATDESSSTGLDASTADASTADASTDDSNSTGLDASTADASTADASTADVSTTDASTADASTADASTADASTADASTADVSTIDASTADASTSSGVSPDPFNPDVNIVDISSTADASSTTDASTADAASTADTSEVISESSTGSDDLTSSTGSQDNGVVEEPPAPTGTDATVTTPPRVRGGPSEVPGIVSAQAPAAQFSSTGSDESNSAISQSSSAAMESSSAMDETSASSDESSSTMEMSNSSSTTAVDSSSTMMDAISSSVMDMSTSSTSSSAMDMSTSSMDMSSSSTAWSRRGGGGAGTPPPADDTPVVCTTCPHEVTYTDTALLFEPCNSDIADNYSVSVNWYPDAAAPTSSSILDYNICRAPSLQPKYLEALELHPLGQAGDDKTDAVRVPICGPNSATKEPCKRVGMARSDCLIGSVRAPMAYNDMLPNVAMSLHANPPATFVFKLCV